MTWMEGVRAVLFDVDGTLLWRDEAIPGAGRAIDGLRALGIPFRAATNTTRRPTSATASVLRKAGVRVEDGEVLAPAVLARRLILDSGRKRAALLVPPASFEDFAGVAIDEDRPDWLVLGDIGRGFHFETLNRAYRWIRGGARLVALHRNRVWDNGVDGLVLDAGPFVAALEYAAEVEAILVGKPAPEFFDLAASDLGVPKDAILMVGDSLEADVRGAAGAGLRTALVLSGATGREDLDRSGMRPDRVFASVADLFPA